MIEAVGNGTAGDVRAITRVGVIGGKSSLSFLEGGVDGRCTGSRKGEGNHSPCTSGRDKPFNSNHTGNIVSCSRSFSYPGGTRGIALQRQVAIGCKPGIGCSKTEGTRQVEHTAGTCQAHTRVADSQVFDRIVEEHVGGEGLGRSSIECHRSVCGIQRSIIGEGAADTQFAGAYGQRCAGGDTEVVHLYGSGIDDRIEGSTCRNRNSCSSGRYAATPVLKIVPV